MKRTYNEIMNNFLDLACDLSPENLYCDGEATYDQVEATLKAVNQNWKKLEEEIGHKVTETDAWDWFRNEKENTKKELNNKQSLEKPVISTKPTKKNFFGV